MNTQEQSREIRFVASDKGAVILTNGRLVKPGQVINASELPADRLRVLVEDGSLLEVAQ